MRPTCNDRFRRFAHRTNWVFLLPFGIACLASTASAQAPKGHVTAEDPPPALTYHGLIPSLSSAADVRKALGEPIHENSWYAYKMLYPATGRPGLIDAIHLGGGRNGTFASAEAASIPAGYESREKAFQALGEPEYELRMPTFTLLDYSAKGVRFVFDAEGKTIGVAYVPHLRTRVHAGARRLVDLRHLRSGPQPRPKKVASCEGLLAGTAQVKLTPLTADWLNPRYRDKFTVHDDLYARCVLFEKDGLTVALIGADLFGMNLPHIQPARDHLQAEGVEYVLFGMSHNHAAPDTIGVYGHFPEEYVRYIHKQIVTCVLKAKSNLREVKEFRTASREMPMDGARVIGYIRNARNPGLVDPTISILQPIGTDGKPIATVVNFACHVEGLEKGVVELSADFPGYMCSQIESDGGGTAVFLNGAVGGMISGDGKERTHEEARLTGLGLAAIVKELAATAQPPEDFQFTADTRRVEIPVTNKRFEPLYKATRPLHHGRVVTEMGLVTLGECQILAVPGELLPELSFEIQEKMTGFPRIIVGLANDELGYIIPTYDFRDDYYEETMSQGPAAAPVIVDTAKRLLAKQK